MPSHAFIRRKLKFDLSATVLLFALLLLACKKFEYSPYQTEKKDRPQNLNATNLSKLLSKAQTGDDTLCVLFTGDSQRFYKSLENLAGTANKMEDVDFLILAGDISDFGLVEEFMWIYERLEKLKMPYFCAIGNHDLTANGAQIYTEMFGARNFSFIYKDHKFIFHDTNGRAYGFNGTVPDLNWMKSELYDSSARWSVAVSHMPPYDVDFDRQLEAPYHALLAARPDFVVSLNGHAHHGNDVFYYNDHVRYITTTSVDHNECLRLKFIKGKIIKENISY
jgi:3',5'-cyclic-AMP phosphodiesterase